jgi:hypothetical protein
MFFGDDSHVMGVLSTIVTKIAQFETVAALWHSKETKAKAEKKAVRNFSVGKFLSKPGILVLGHDDTHKESIAPLNNLLMRALSDEILRRENHSGPRHWFILDEFPAMEKAMFVASLLNRGRSKGVSVLIGTQGIEGMTKQHGEDGAEEIIGNCGNKAFLRAGGPKTARWMEHYFGNIRSTETNWSQARSKDGTTYTDSQATHDRPQFNSSFFSSLPYPEPGGRMVLVGDGPGTGPVVASRPFNRVLSWLKPLGNVPGVMHRNDVDSQVLHKWKESESEFFCKAVEAVKKPRKKKRAKAKPASSLPKRRRKKSKP